MKIRDASVLVISKLRIRKLRTVVTIITASILFSVIICMLFLIKGLANNLMSSSNIVFGGKTVLAVNYYRGNYDTSEIQEKAVELYEASNDPDKQYPIITPEPNDGFTLPPYLDSNNSFSILAAQSYVDEQNVSAEAIVDEIARDYGGRVESIMNYYEIEGSSLSIDGLSSHNNWPGVRVAVIYGPTIEQLVRASGLRDDLIQVVVSVDSAAKLLQIEKPSERDADRDVKIMDYIEEANRRAIGFTFSGIVNKVGDGVGYSGIDSMQVGEGVADVPEESEVMYEIVGLIPSYVQPRSIDYSVNPVDMIVGSLSANNYPSDTFIVANYDSPAFKLAYRLSIDNNAYSTRVLTAFSDVEEAYEFSRKYSCNEPGCSPMMSVDEFISNKFNLRVVLEHVDKLLVAFAVVFSIVAAIIMAGTLSRVVGDERQTIALYRVVGASSGNIVEIFTGYVLMLCLFMIVCSAVFGFCLASVISFMNSTHAVSFISEMYNVTSMGSVFLVGYDTRILFIFAIILVIGFACILLVLEKLLSRDIVRGLRK